ncbi:hypothetical protein [Croceiramulus getboli]|nr:hypothetical protein P8624_00085 [Flavobacteriaceae bacterium YJPT1-3]
MNLYWTFSFKIILLLPLIIFLSCQERKLDKKIESCVVNGVKSWERGNIEFYEFAKKIENAMMNAQLLKGKGKQDYTVLFNSIGAESTPTRQFYNEHIETFHADFPVDLFFINNLVFNQCPYEVYSKNKEENEILKRIGLLQLEAMDNGFEDIQQSQKILEEYTTSDFDKIGFRAPIIYLALLNMDRKYNSEIEKLRRRNADKVFLN